MTILSFLSICPFPLVLDKMDNMDNMDSLDTQKHFVRCRRIESDIIPTKLRSNYGVFTW